MHSKILTLYKSVSLERAFDILEKGTFYYSNFFDFNDSNEVNFDLNNYINDDSLREISDIILKILNSAQFRDEWTTNKSKEIIDLLNSKDTSQNLNALINFLKLTHTFCTSLTYDEKMWEKEYTNFGRGICFLLEHRCYNNAIIKINGIDHLINVER